MKLIDFAYTHKSLVHSTSEKGTQAYLAPEIYEGKSYDTKKADVFALGVTLFNMVTGRSPFVEADYYSDSYYELLTKDFDLYWYQYVCGLSKQKIHPVFKNIIRKTLARK